MQKKKKSSTEWKQGDSCKAVWSKNGKYIFVNKTTSIQGFTFLFLFNAHRHFNAVIDMISEDGQTCTVTFDGYGTTEIVRVNELMPRDWEEPMIRVEKDRAKTSR